MMKINNKFKPIVKLVNLLMPNYILNPRACIGISNRAPYIDIYYIPDLNSEYRAYVGFLCLKTVHVIPDNPTAIILAVPYLNSLTKNLIKDWKSIGVYFKAWKCAYKQEYYYIIGINDAENTKGTVN